MWFQKQVRDNYHFSESASGIYITISLWYSLVSMTLSYSKRNTKKAVFMIKCIIVLNKSENGILCVAQLNNEGKIPGEVFIRFYFMLSE